MTERDARRPAERRPARDPAFIRKTVPLLWPLVDRWFRPDTRGLGNIPSHGAVLLVGNHSGGNVPVLPARARSRRRCAAARLAAPLRDPGGELAERGAGTRFGRRRARLPGRGPGGASAELAWQPRRLPRPPRLHPARARPPRPVALPWGLDVGDMLGHIPLPAKLTIEVLPPIDLAARYGDAPDVRTIYDDVVGLMQRTLDDLAAERRWPVLG